MASALAPEIPSGASRGIRARPERDPERASEPGRFGPLRVTLQRLARRLCSARAGPQACLRAQPRQNFERICGLSRVKPEHGVSSGLWTCRFLAAPAKLRAYLWAFKSETRARCFFRIMDLSFSCW